MPNGVSNKEDGLLEATFMRVSLISVCYEDSARPNLIRVILNSCISDSLRLITILLAFDLNYKVPLTQASRSKHGETRKSTIKHRHES